MIRTVRGEPPRKVPPEVRQAVHQRLDTLLNEYEWGIAPLPLRQTFGWYLEKHAGEVRLSVGEPFA